MPSLTESQSTEGEPARRWNMHQIAGLGCLAVALPCAWFSQPIAASLILCGVTSYSIGLLVKEKP
ncbi:hypothetical protein Pan44_22780 [Caulifigura coniformis]|uniref:Uncharacterized protein n=1 Tax=Caulifigura coniformis TaxID=2527983 RepID=A0A517SDQ2_9PLAN|nr:hypothetical protein [Caulifigura coniformis]QDT54250.1 hypothetical protein Pan44_22780 [Caulifigura coniformis]